MNKQTQKTMFSSKSMVWETPDGFFYKLNKKYKFTLDAAANKNNTKCDKFFTEEDNALEQDWSGNVVFCNPPYGRQLKYWVKKFYEEGLKPNTTVVALIPARTDTFYYHNYCMHAREIYFVKGRLKFLNENKEEMDPAPFPSMVVVFKQAESEHLHSSPKIYTMER